MFYCFVNITNWADCPLFKGWNISPAGTTFISLVYRFVLWAKWEKVKATTKTRPNTRFGYGTVCLFSRIKPFTSHT
jgi:hypothetical protein